MGSLEDIITNLRDSATMFRESVPLAAKAVEYEARSALAQGYSINGVAWTQTIDGRVPMRGASRALRVTGIGNIIVLAIGEPYIYHHFGAGKKPIRLVVPTGDLPDKIGNAIRLGYFEIIPAWCKGSKTWKRA